MSTAMNTLARFVLLLALSLVLASQRAGGQTLAQQFQATIPFDSWPKDPNHPLRRICDAVQDNDAGLHWVASSGTPRPAGVPEHAVLVDVVKRYFEFCWFGNCCVVEVELTFTIVFNDPGDGPSKYTYQQLGQLLRCDTPSGPESAYSRSILSVATIGLWRDVSIQSTFFQKLNGVVVSDTKVGAVKAAPTDTVKPTAALRSMPADAVVSISAAPGGVVDLTGNDGSAPVCTTASPATIHASTILMDAGVSLSQLFSPSPVVLPAWAEVDLRVSQGQYPVSQAPLPGIAEFSIVNLGNTQVPIVVSWSDTLGWAAPGSASIAPEPGEFLSVPVPLVYPPTGQPTDHTRITIVATPLSTLGAPVTFAHDVYFDSDIDADGIKNTLDPCPFVANGPSSLNADNDLIPDVCDACPLVFNFFPYEDPAADFSGDGALTVGDIFAFLNAWFAGDLAADADGVGGLTVQDIFYFLNIWFAGC